MGTLFLYLIVTSCSPAFKREYLVHGATLSVLRVRLESDSRHQLHVYFRLGSFDVRFYQQKNICETPELCHPRKKKNKFQWPDLIGTLRAQSEELHFPRRIFNCVSALFTAKVKLDLQIRKILNYIHFTKSPLIALILLWSQLIVFVSFLYVLR